MKTNSREFAFQMLTRIETDHAYANLLLDVELPNANFADPRDIAFATELVYGVARWQKRLDWFLDQVCKKPMAANEPPLRRILRMGAYQLLMLDRVPASAAINEAVNLAGKYHASIKLPEQVAKGVVNGSLRQLDRQRDRLRAPETADDPVTRIAAAHSFPEWLVARWIARIGEAQTEECCRMHNQPSSPTLRVNSLKTSVPEAIAELAAQGIAAERLPGNLPGVTFADAPPLHQLDGMRQGRWMTQNASSMVIAFALDPQPGEQILETCAGSGVKTTQIAELMQNRGKITAADAHQGKINRLRALCKRMGVMNVRPFCGEMTTVSDLPSKPKDGYDRILVDAPCSGFGVLRKQPEAKWTRRPADIAELSGLQLRLLTHAATLLKRRGGVLVYSACTTEPEENEEVIAEFLRRVEGFRVESLLPHLPETLHLSVTADGFLRIEPPRPPFDGFFCARLVSAESSNMKSS